jgi:hypothetical protein
LGLEAHRTVVRARGNDVALVNAKQFSKRQTWVIVGAVVLVALAAAAKLLGIV